MDSTEQYLNFYRSFSQQSLPDANTASSHAARDVKLAYAFVFGGALWLCERIHAYVLSDDISAQSLIFPAAYVAWAAATKVRSSNRRHVIDAVKRRKDSKQISEAETKLLDRSSRRAAYADMALTGLYTATAVCLNPIVGTAAGFYLYNRSRVQEIFYKAAANYAAYRGPLITVE